MSRVGRGKKRGGEGSSVPAEAAVNNDNTAADTAEVSPKTKRKYVKSGKFVGRFNHYQRKKGTGANQEGQAGRKRRNKRDSGRVEGIASDGGSAVGCIVHTADHQA